MRDVGGGVWATTLSLGLASLQPHVSTDTVFLWTHLSLNAGWYFGNSNASPPK